MTSIALVEDNDDLRQLTSRFLSLRGYAVQEAAAAEDLAEFHNIPDIYVIDLNLPETSGYDLVRNLRAASDEVGIIILSARERARDITDGYDAGADIYLTKPVSPEILLAALGRLERRGHRQARSGQTLQIDRAKRQIVQPQGNNIRLSEAELGLLYYLSVAGDRGMERYEIAQSLGMNLDQEINKALEVRITRLRKKLRQAGAADPAIENRRGIGYRLTTPIMFQ
jgi:DNA-binding response OmpR family regulator